MIILPLLPEIAIKCCVIKCDVFQAREHESFKVVVCDMVVSGKWNEKITLFQMKGKYWFEKSFQSTMI